MNNEEIFSSDYYLKPENMISLYARGAFPMADDDGTIEWYFPEIRTVIPIDNYNVPRSLKKFMTETQFNFTYDKDYLQVIRSCANRSKTWISEKLIDAYKGLYNLGHLHSVEIWSGNTLAGGLYGVTYKGAFFGESMFSNETQASKAALIKLLERLKEREFKLLDVQYITPHLKMFGAIEIPFVKYEMLLVQAYKSDVFF